MQRQVILPPANVLDFCVEHFYQPQLPFLAELLGVGKASLCALYIAGLMSLELYDTVNANRELATLYALVVRVWRATCEEDAPLTRPGMLNRFVVALVFTLSHSDESNRAWLTHDVYAALGVSVNWHMLDHELCVRWQPAMTAELFRCERMFLRTDA